MPDTMLGSENANVPKAQLLYFGAEAGLVKIVQYKISEQRVIQKPLGI